MSSTTSTKLSPSHTLSREETQGLPKTQAGDYTFAMHHDWARSSLPKGQEWGETHALAELADGRIVVVHTGGKGEKRDTVIFLNADGSYESSWGEDLAGPAHGLELLNEDGKEFLLLTHQEKGLFKFTLDGETVWHFEKPALYQKNFFLKWSPSNIAVTPDGTIYLADGYGTGFIVVLNAQGEEQTLIGGPGLRPENVMHPHGIGIDLRGDSPTVVVPDNLEAGLHYLTLDGEHISKDLCGMRDPRHVRWDGDTMIVADLCGCVTLLDKNNTVLGHLGDAETDLEHLFPLRELPPEQLPQGSFVHPHDAIALKNGDFLVAEWVSHGRLTRLYRQ